MELALRAADQVDCGVVEELTKSVGFGRRWAVQLQVVVADGSAASVDVSRNATDCGLYARGMLKGDLSVRSPPGAARLRCRRAHQHSPNWL